ncbi:MAG TPA: hypothetical protein VEQ10_09360 [Vicinamibacteria bacterium]|nr:hypothetical protein [Vicinamibacteria bacterium]
MATAGGPDAEKPGAGTPCRWQPPWAIATAAVAIVAVVTAGVVYVFHSARALPADVLGQGRAVLREVAEVAAAFRTGTITTSFRGYATRVQGTSRLEFAELQQLEVFERRDSESLLWGTLTLPDVVVEARAPVEYSYYLDLDKEWRFRLQGREVLVLAPAVEWNQPAVDVSALRYEVREGSVLRNEQIVQDRLRSELTALAAMRARQHLPLVREVGRRKVEGFVETWLLQRFTDGGGYRARVRFADEPAPPPPHPPVVPTPSG